MVEDNVQLARKLFSLSPLKQEKFRRLSNYIGDAANKRCLDLGSDNGVISLVLRELGGSSNGKWASADLTEQTVAAIRSVVKQDVYQTDGRTLPFENNSFDLVAIVDLLEHISTDLELIAEIHRILKPQGVLIINVPNPKEGLLRSIRYRLGQTDAAHGHLRAGYNVLQIYDLIQKDFVLERYAQYSRFFSELVDTLITLGIDILKRGKSGAKGRVTTTADLKSQQKQLFFYSLLYPLLKLATLLDRLTPFVHGNMLIVRAVAVK